MKLKLSINNLLKYLILTIIFIANFLLLAHPNYNNLKNIHNELKNEANELELKYTAGQDLNRSSDDYQEINDSLPSYESLFIKQGNELSLVTKLEELADINRIDQKLDLGVNKNVISENIISVPFNFSLKGDFNDFMQYLKTLRQLTYNLTIQNIELKQTEDSDLQIQLLGHTYWLTDKK